MAAPDKPEWAGARRRQPFFAAATVSLFSQDEDGSLLTRLSGTSRRSCLKLVNEVVWNPPTKLSDQ